MFFPLQLFLFKIIKSTKYSTFAKGSFLNMDHIKILGSVTNELKDNIRNIAFRRSFIQSFCLI